MSKHILIPIVIFTICFVSTSTCFAQDTGVYLRVGLGAGKPLLNALSVELEKQGNQMPDLEYTLPVSIGRKFLNGSVGAELIFSYSLTTNIKYKNDYEDFEEKLGHYGFSLILRKYLLPGNNKFSPSIGAGIGYGRSNLVAGGGRLESAELIASTLIESSFKKNTDFFVEAVYVHGLGKGRFDDAHLETINEDIVLNSEGSPLEDSYSVFEIRAGFTFHLRNPKRYY
ncbi:hypothetical protein J7M07_03000 [bacterium]|nr:hypothetical protein [bacterium]